MRRSHCLAKPRRRPLGYYICAHSLRGHGVHSPFLYALCEEVFWPLRRAKRAQERQAVSWLKAHGACNITVLHHHHSVRAIWLEWCRLNRDQQLVTIDCYTYGLAFQKGGMPAHRLALRPRLRSLVPRGYAKRRGDICLE